MTNRQFRAELHCHSTASDGTLTPKQIVDLAVESNLSGLSITDHDTVGGYASALPYAVEKGLPMIVGTEFSTVFQNHPIHVLAYSFKMDHPLIIKMVEEHKARRIDRVKRMLIELEKCGMPLDFAEISSTVVIGRPHIAEAMRQRGYVSNIQEAFKKYLGEGKKCFVESYAPTATETIEAIHAANGFALIAHPHLVKPTHIVKPLLDLPFDGLEAYYANMPKHTNQRWVKLAEAREMIITGGSDFHGSHRPQISLGASWTNQETFETLKLRFDANN